jgi:hypothetical protein
MKNLMHPKHQTPEGRLTLQYIREHTQTREGKPITRYDLAAFSGLPLTDVYIIEIGGYSSTEKVETILQAFYSLTGRSLSMKDIACRTLETVASP